MNDIEREGTPDSEKLKFIGIDADDPHGDLQLVLRGEALVSEMIIPQFSTVEGLTSMVQDESSYSPSETDALQQRLDAKDQEIERYRELASRLDNKVFQMRTLLQSGKGFSEVLSIDSLLKAFMAVCRERYDVDCSAVMLLDDLDPDDIFYRVRAYHGLPNTYRGHDGIVEEIMLFRLPRDQGMLWQVINQGEVFSVTDMRGEPRFKTAFKNWQLEVLHADVWVPLIRGGEVLGLLTLGSSERGKEIPEDEYDFLEEIAAVAVTNIDSTLKYEKNARILSNLRTLYDINQQLANVNDFKRLTIETLSTAVGALSAQKANLMLYNHDTERLEIKVVWGNIPVATREAINEGRMSTKSFTLGEGVAGRAAQTAKPVRLNDRDKIPQVGRNRVYCILSAPLIYGGEAMGVMTLTNKTKLDDNGEAVLDTLGRFGEDDEQLLLGLADQAAVNLHKARLYTASITDRLTGLFNARYFDTRFEASVRQAVESKEPLALAVTDIDHFKKFNDTYGHKAGDFVLAETARLLKEATPTSDDASCFRYGGEEFTMLLPDTTLEDAARVLEAYRRNVEEAEFEYEGQMLSVTISVGLAACPANSKNRQELFEAADQTLYAAKKAGRNRVAMAGEDGPVFITPISPETTT